MSIYPRRMRSLVVAGLLSVVVKVPFDFRAGAVRFEPGEYVLALDRAAEGSVTIRSESTGRSTSLDVRKSGESGTRPTSTVIFRAYGELRFLSAIQVEGGERWEVSASADEAALARTHGTPKVMSLKAQVRPPD